MAFLSAASLVVAAVSLVAGLAHRPTDPIAGGSSADYSAPPPPYPISGYFVSAGVSDSSNRNKLAEIKALGGDTVITFGTLLKPAALADLPKDCVIDGMTCGEAAAHTVKVDRYFTYSDGSRWGARALKCPQDRDVTTKEKLYTILLLPVQGAGCTSKSGIYDVVIVGGSSKDADDPSKSLATAATELDMKYYAGLPSPVKRTDVDYLPDLSYKRTLELFTDRFLEYQSAVNDVPGLAGFYHHTEMPVTDSPTFDPILDLYTVQNEAIRRVLPTRAVIVSPYLDTRVNTASISLDAARKGARRIAETSAGLTLNIAIQDGMGTGKAGAFSAADANESVDVFAEAVVGKGSWASKYVAPIRDYFLASAAGISGTGAVLWANLEGMAPATGSNPCGSSLRGQTTKARTDRQLQQLSDAVKVVSFMWDSYYTCKGTGTPLKSQVESGLTTPIITNAKFRASSGKVEISGFNLAGGMAVVKWTTKNGQFKENSGRPSATNQKFGQQRGLNPRLEMITVDVGETTLDTSKNFVVNVTNGWGAKAPNFFPERG